MQFEELYRQRTERHITISEAARLLGVHERTFRRWSRRYEEQGAEGLADARLDRVAHNAADTDEVMALLALYETRYQRFNTAHFFDKYRDKHNGRRSYTWVKMTLQSHGIVPIAKKRGTHRRKREREAMRGMMLHQDGSRHLWVPGVYWDLIVTLDDATSEIYSAFFVDEEGTLSTFRAISEVIKSHGLFCSLYTDRGSHYWTTNKAGGKVNKESLTQVGRAMAQLGIEMIAAYSPEARGRSERMFGTLQGRLPQELALEGITDMDKANQFLKEKYLPAHNRRFTCEPASIQSAFVPWLDNNLNLDEILCIQDKRVASKDNTISYENKTLQIPAQEVPCRFAKKTISVHKYSNGEISLFFGPRHLGRYDAEGQLIDEGSPEVKITAT